MKAFSKVFLLALTLIVSGSMHAQDVPLNNWSPAPWPGRRTTNITTNAYSTAFMPMLPCRVYDSRTASALTGLTSRTVDIDGGPCSGIPAGASAYSINITVFGSVSSGSYEFVTAYATGSTRPSVSTMNFLTGTQTSNAATVPAGNNSDIDIYTTYTTHFTVDINGYYTIYQASGDGFASVSGSGIGVIGVSNAGYGVEGVSSASFGVVGVSSGNGSSAAGVIGSSSDATGVIGASTNYTGVWATSTYHDAIFASGGRDGAYVEGPRNGLIGASTGTTGTLFGVIGTAASVTTGSAGVLGRLGTAMTWTDSSIPSGIRGDGKAAVGVIGFSEYIGVAGVTANTDGSARVEGHLATGNYGVYSFGDTGATGTKSFIEPHPTDPQKIVKYVSLEGPEAGTYFRGRAVVQGGRATIEVPESFRIVTDAEGLTVHLTPIGRLALIGVVSADLDHIVVEATRDVEFSYIVYGVRKAFKDFQPIQMQEGEFMPMTPASRLPTAVPEESRRRLIETGVYNEDGTVNMETAERLGWTKLWRDRGVAADE